jgi:hypothetical protein
MRFFEFDGGQDRLRLIFNTLIGRATSKKQPAQFNWGSINAILTASGLEPINYAAFKTVFDADPAIQSLVKNFNDDGIEFKVPGVADEPGAGSNLDQSKDEVGKIAAGAAPANIAQ